MRSRNLSRHRDGLGWALWAGLVILVLLILGLVGLGFYAAREVAPPARHAVEQVLPNDKFPK
jgi:hypothetical protein